VFSVFAHDNLSQARLSDMRVALFRFLAYLSIHYQRTHVQNGNGQHVADIQVVGHGGGPTADIYDNINVALDLETRDRPVIGYNDHILLS